MKIQKIRDYVLGPLLKGADDTPYRMLVNQKPEKNLESRYIAVSGGLDTKNVRCLEIMSSNQNFIICYPDTMIPMSDFNCNVYRPLKKLLGK